MSSSSDFKKTLKKLSTVAKGSERFKEIEISKLFSTLRESAIGNADRSADLIQTTLSLLPNTDDSTSSHLLGELEKTNTAMKDWAAQNKTSFVPTFTTQGVAVLPALVATNRKVAADLFRALCHEDDTWKSDAAPISAALVTTGMELLSERITASEVYTAAFVAYDLKSLLRHTIKDESLVSACLRQIVNIVPVLARKHPDLVSEMGKNLQLTVKSYPNLSAVFVKEGVALLPDLAAAEKEKGEAAAGTTAKFFSHLRETANNNSAPLASDLITGTLPLLPAVAAANSDAAIDIISTLKQASHMGTTYKDMSPVFVREGLPILSPLTTQGGHDTAAHLVIAIAENVQGTPATPPNRLITRDKPLNTDLVTQGLSILSGVKDIRLAGRIVFGLARITAQRIDDEPLTRTIVKQGLAILPALAAKDGDVADKVVWAMGEAARHVQDAVEYSKKYSDGLVNAAFIPTFVEDGLAILPEVAAKRGSTAGKLVVAMTKAARGDDALTAKVFAQGLDITSGLDAKNAAELITELAKAAQGNDTLTAAVVTHGLDITSRLDAKDAVELVTKLAKAAQGNDTITTNVVTHGLSILPALAAMDEYEASKLVTVLAKAAQGNDTLVTGIATQVLAALPPLVAANSPTPPHLIEALAETKVIDVGNGLVCQEFMISAPDGEGQQTVICFGNSPDNTMLKRDYFTGPLTKFESEVKSRWTEGSSMVTHHQGVLGTAFAALAHRETLPSFLGNAVTAKAAAPACA